jgi:hypothetical protein
MLMNLYLFLEYYLAETKDNQPVVTLAMYISLQQNAV